MYAESKYNTENSFTTNAGSKKKHPNIPHHRNANHQPISIGSPCSKLLHNNKSRGIVFGTFNRLRLYLLGNRELTFTSSKKIN